jgi:hypothetical protein
MGLIEGSRRMPAHTPRARKLTKLAAAFASTTATILVLLVGTGAGSAWARYTEGFHAEQFGYKQTASNPGTSSAAKVTYAAKDPKNYPVNSYTLVNDPLVPKVPGCTGDLCESGTTYGIMIKALNGLPTAYNCNSSTDGSSCHNAGVIRGYGAISYTNSSTNVTSGLGNLLLRVREDANCAPTMQITIWDSTHTQSRTSAPITVNNSTAYQIYDTGLLPFGDGTSNTDVVAHTSKGQCPLYIDWVGYHPNTLA